MEAIELFEINLQSPQKQYEKPTKKNGVHYGRYFSYLCSSKACINLLPISIATVFAGGTASLATYALVNLNKNPEKMFMPGGYTSIASLSFISIVFLGGFGIGAFTIAKKCCQAINEANSEESEPLMI